MTVKATLYQFDPAGSRLPSAIPPEMQSSNEGWAARVQRNMHNKKFNFIAARIQ